MRASTLLLRGAAHACVLCAPAFHVATCVRICYLLFRKWFCYLCVTDAQCSLLSRMFCACARVNECEVNAVSSDMSSRERRQSHVITSAAYYREGMCGAASRRITLPVNVFSARKRNALFLFRTSVHHVITLRLRLASVLLLLYFMLINCTSARVLAANCSIAIASSSRVRAGALKRVA